MPITFGSVGDIISICLIVKDLVAALDDSRGSKSEYREVIRELHILDRALLEVDILSRTCERTPELLALCKTARQTAQNCRQSIEAFTRKIKKYDASLCEGSSRNFLRDTVMKIRWVSQREDLEKFRAEVTGHSSSMNMLLATASVKLLQISDQKLDAHINVSQQRAESHDNLIIEVREQLRENNRLISASTHIAKNIAENLRLEWLRQLGSDLKLMMQRIFTMNVATYNAVLAIKSGLPSYLERSLIQEPFILEDAIGRISPVHLQFISSWEAFEAVLELRFRLVQGYTKVKSREYVLQEHATRQEIRRHLPWEVSFLPGQRVDMALVFEDKEVKTAGQTTCPRCQAPSRGLLDSDIQCTNCDMWYRRITEYKDVEPPPPPKMTSIRRKHVLFGQSSFTTAPTTPSPPEEPTANRHSKGKSIDTETQDMNHVSYFKRVRVISSKTRIKHIPGPFSSHTRSASESVLSPRAKLEAQEQTLRESFEEKAAVLGLKHKDTRSSLEAFAWCLRNQRKFAVAEDLFRASYDANCEELVVKDPWSLQVMISSLMTVLADQNKPSEIDELRQVTNVMFRSNLEPEVANLLLHQLHTGQVSRNQVTEQECLLSPPDSLNMTSKAGTEGNTGSPTTPAAWFGGGGDSRCPCAAEIERGSPIPTVYGCGHPSCSINRPRSSKTRQAHDGNDSYECCYCPKIFPTRRIRHNHEQQHEHEHRVATVFRTEKRRSAGKRCSAEKRPSAKKIYPMEKLLANPSPDGTFGCHLCKSKFFAFETLELHVGTHKLYWPFTSTREPSNS